MRQKQQRLNTTHTPKDRGSVTIIRLPALRAKLGGVSKATIYRMMAEGLLPKNVAIGPRSVGWIEAQVDEMFWSRVEEA